MTHKLNQNTMSIVKKASKKAKAHRSDSQVKDHEVAEETSSTEEQIQEEN